MNARILTLLAVLAAPAAFAQYHGAVAVQPAPMPAVVQQPCGPQPAPVNNSGRWELRTTQRYVPGFTQQVYVAGQCRVGHRGRQFCEPGRYVTTQTAGHYESQQNWVWVAYDRSDYGRHERREEHRRYGRSSRVEFNVGFR
ncbi:MAG: hypothetical protein JNM69_38850 [Archangium sp.]|nr:hypothetical protein [Archangium sp.]